MVLVLLAMLLVVVLLLFSWLLVHYLMQKSDSHYQITTQGADFVHVLLHNSHDEINRGQINLKNVFFKKFANQSDFEIIVGSYKKKSFPERQNYSSIKSSKFCL